MKNLANCTPREFMRQTSKIRHAVEKWLTITDIMNIRKRLPEIPVDATKEEKDKLLIEQSRKNIGFMLDAIMDEHPDETLELMALCCFVPLEDIDNYPMSEYLGSITDMISNEDVIRFFISLVRLGQTLGLKE